MKTPTKHTYQIVSANGGAHLAGRKCNSDAAAKMWLQDLLNRGVISGIPVMLQRFCGASQPKKLTSNWLFSNSGAKNWLTI